jgi:hypothetical protein
MSEKTLRSARVYARHARVENKAAEALAYARVALMFAYPEYARHLEVA